MKKTPWLPVLGAILFAASSAQAATIQFGGEAGIVSNTDFQSQIGASQVIQWNGVNSAGGSFGASGSVTNNAAGEAAGAALTSVGPEALTLTSQAIQPIGAGAATTKADSLPNVVGVSNPKFDAGESWTIDFDQDVALKHLVFSALNFNGETIEITTEGGSSVSFNRTNSLVAAVTYSDNSTTNNRFVYTPAGGSLALASGQDLTIAALTGSWGLQAVVVETSEIPEPGTVAVLATSLLLACTARLRTRC